MRRSKAKSVADEAEAEDNLELSQSQLRELNRRIADAKDPTRFVIESRIGKTFALYYNVTDDVYVWKDARHATLFKRRAAAEAIRKLLRDGTRVMSCTTRRRKGELSPVLSSLKAVRGTKRGSVL